MTGPARCAASWSLVAFCSAKVAILWWSESNFVAQLLSRSERRLWRVRYTWRCSCSRVECGVHFFESRVVDVRVDLRGGDAGVAEHLLDQTEIGAARKKMRRETVPQRVGTDIARRANRAAYFLTSSQIRSRRSGCPRGDKNSRSLGGLAASSQFGPLALEIALNGCGRLRFPAGQPAPCPLCRGRRNTVPPGACRGAASRRVQRRGNRSRTSAPRVLDRVANTFHLERGQPVADRRRVRRVRLARVATIFARRAVPRGFLGAHLRVAGIERIPAAIRRVGQYSMRRVHVRPTKLGSPQDPESSVPRASARQARRRIAAGRGRKRGLCFQPSGIRSGGTGRIPAANVGLDRSPRHGEV